MPRYLALVGAIAALALAARSAEGAAGAEGSSPGGSPSLSTGELPASGDAQLAGGPRVRGAGAPASPAPEGLTESETGALHKLAAENPELAEQSGGYISNEELLTILLVVIIVMIIL